MIIKSCILHWPVVAGAAFRGGLREAARTARSEVPPAGAAPETLDAPRERYPEHAEWIARTYRDHGDIMRRIADEAGLHYSSAGKIIKAWDS